MDNEVIGRGEEKWGKPVQYFWWASYNCYERTTWDCQASLIATTHRLTWERVEVPLTVSAWQHRWRCNKHKHTRPWNANRTKNITEQRIANRDALPKKPPPPDLFYSDSLAVGACAIALGGSFPSSSGMAFPKSPATWQLSNWRGRTNKNFPFTFEPALMLQEFPLNYRP